MKSKYTYNPYFLENKEFIQWRLTRTPELENLWTSYIHENPGLEEEFQKAIEVFDKIAINKRIFKDTDVLYDRIIESNLYNKHKKKRFLYSVSSAAAIALLLLATTFYFIRKDSSSKEAISAEVIGKTLPEQEVMLLAGGKEIVLSQNVTVQLNNGQISYTDSTTSGLVLSSVGDFQKAQRKSIVKGKACGAGA